MDEKVNAMELGVIEGISDIEKKYGIEKTAVASEMLYKMFKPYLDLSDKDKEEYREVLIDLMSVVIGVAPKGGGDVQDV